MPHGWPVCLAKLGNALAVGIVPNVTALKTKPKMAVAVATPAPVNIFCVAPIRCA